MSARGTPFGYSHSFQHDWSDLRRTGASSPIGINGLSPETDDIVNNERAPYQNSPIGSAEIQRPSHSPAHILNIFSPSSQSEAFIKAISVSPSVSVSNYTTEPGSDDDLNDFQLTPSAMNYNEEFLERMGGMEEIDSDHDDDFEFNSIQQNHDSYIPFGVNDSSNSPLSAQSQNMLNNRLVQKSPLTYHVLSSVGQQPISSNHFAQNSIGNNNINHYSSSAPGLISSNYNTPIGSMNFNHRGSNGSPISSFSSNSHTLAQRTNSQNNIPSNQNSSFQLSSSPTSSTLSSSPHSSSLHSLSSSSPSSNNSLNSPMSQSVHSSNMIGSSPSGLHYKLSSSPGSTGMGLGLASNFQLNNPMNYNHDHSMSMNKIIPIHQSSQSQSLLSIQLNQSNNQLPTHPQPYNPPINGNNNSIQGYSYKSNPVTVTEGIKINQSGNTTNQSNGNNQNTQINSQIPSPNIHIPSPSVQINNNSPSGSPKLPPSSPVSNLSPPGNQYIEHPVGEHPSRTLFVRNINSNVEEQELRTLFENFGPLRSMYTQCKHRGFVMISYFDIRHSKNAMRNLQGKLLRRRKLDIHYSIPKDNPSEKDQNQGTLVVFNLDSTITSEELMKIFGTYGEIKEIRETPNKKHHKFIEFYDVRDAEKAMKQLNKTEIKSKKIKIEPSRPGGRKSSVTRDDLLLQSPNGTFQSLSHFDDSDLDGPLSKSAPSNHFMEMQQLNYEIANQQQSPRGPQQEINDYSPFNSPSRGENYLNQQPQRTSSNPQVSPARTSKPTNVLPISSSSIQSQSQSPSNSRQGQPQLTTPSSSWSASVSTIPSSRPPRSFSLPVNGDGDVDGLDRKFEEVESPEIPESIISPRKPPRKDSDRNQFILDIRKVEFREDIRTTLMIKNIPNKYTQKMLLATVDDTHKGLYDFFYLPIDFKNKCNVGYAFINFMDPISIISFYRKLHDTKWEKFNSEKVCDIAYARIQGKDALINHFQNSSLMSEDKQCRPIIFHSNGPNIGQQAPFPIGPNIRIRPKEEKPEPRRNKDDIRTNLGKKTGNARSRSYSYNK